MAIQLRPTSGTRVYLSTTLPATADAAGYGAIADWAEFAGFDNIGEIGDMDEVGNFDSITEGRIKYRSINDPGQIEGTPADLPADPGQVIAKGAKDAPKGGVGEVISFRVEDESGVGTYAQVMVSSWRRVYGGAADVQLRRVVMPIIAGTIVEY